MLLQTQRELNTLCTKSPPYRDSLSARYDFSAYCKYNASLVYPYSDMCMMTTSACFTMGVGYSEIQGCITCPHIGNTDDHPIHCGDSCLPGMMLFLISAVTISSSLAVTKFPTACEMADIRASCLCSSSSSNRAMCCCWCFTNSLSRCDMITASMRGLTDGELRSLNPACWVVRTSSCNFCYKQEHSANHLHNMIHSHTCKTAIMWWYFTYYCIQIYCNSNQVTV